MVRVLAAGIAELRELKPPSGRLLVLRRRVVPVLAHRTLQCDNVAHFVCSPNVASHFGWQAACLWRVDDDPAPLTRRDTGPLAPAANPELSYGKRCGQATHNLLLLSTKSLF